MFLLVEKGQFYFHDGQVETMPRFGRRHGQGLALVEMVVVLRFLVFPLHDRRRG
jgi:hypothetical protein